MLYADLFFDMTAQKVGIFIGNFKTNYASGHDNIFFKCIKITDMASLSLLKVLLQCM